jgi:predicted ArsR family transcriptional regulator
MNGFPVARTPVTRRDPAVPTFQESVMGSFITAPVQAAQMSELREAIAEHVRSRPGVHFNELARNLDIATGQAQYHLRRLRKRDDLVTEKLRGRTHYFPDGYDPWERRAVALFRQETTRGIIAHALECGTPAAADLARDLDIARSTVSWHVSTLVEAGLAEKTYDSRGRVHVRLTHPDETRRLLEQVTPTFPDRLVDRFTRLVDESLPE